MFCVLKIHGVKDMTVDERKKAAKCVGWPFFPPLRRGKPSRTDRSQSPIGVGIDFSSLPSDTGVSFQDIDRFEEINGGAIQVYVYQWSQIPWLNDTYYYLTAIRSPSIAAEEAEDNLLYTVKLLLRAEHYVLIYDLNALSSVRSRWTATTRT